MKIRVGDAYKMYQTLHTRNTGLMFKKFDMDKTAAVSIAKIAIELEKSINYINDITLFLKENQEPIKDKEGVVIGTKLNDANEKELEAMLAEEVEYDENALRDFYENHKISFIFF